MLKPPYQQCPFCGQRMPINQCRGTLPSQCCSYCLQWVWVSDSFFCQLCSTHSLWLEVQRCFSCHSAPANICLVQAYMYKKHQNKRHTVTVLYFDHGYSLGCVCLHSMVLFVNLCQRRSSSYLCLHVCEYAMQFILFCSQTWMKCLGFLGAHGSGLEWTVRTM